MEPVLLYPMLRAMGMAWEHSVTPRGGVELLIRESPPV
jgi:hypothetical protein